MEVVTNTLNYVVEGYLFWHTIGFTIATAIFIGATLYDGDTTTLKKGLITVGTYAGFLFMLNAGRLIGAEVFNINHAQRYAGLMSLVLITIAYLSGLIMGVHTVKYARKGAHSQ